MAGSYAPFGYRYIPQLTTQGTTDYAQITANETATDAWMQNRAMYGDTGYTTIAEALTTIGSTATTLVIPSTAGAIAIAVNTTVPSNVQLSLGKGASFAIANGVTLTINGPLDAGPYQIFSYTGTGKAEFSTARLVREFPVIWWGATGDGATDDVLAIQYAVNAAGSANGGDVIFHAGTFRITDVINLGDGDGAGTASTYNGVRLIGTSSGSLQSPTMTTIIYVDSATNPIVIKGAFYGWAIKYIGFEFTATALGLYIFDGINGDMEHCAFYNCTTVPLYISSYGYHNSMFNRFDELNFYCDNLGDNQAAIKLTSNGSGAHTANSCFNTFDRVFIYCGNPNQFGIQLAACDSNLFNVVDIYNTCVRAVLFDYTEGALGGSTGWPGSNRFLFLDTNGNDIDNNGSPTYAGYVAPNFIHLLPGNASRPANIANVVFHTVQDKAMLWQNGAQSIDSTTYVHVDTTGFDTADLCTPASNIIGVRVAGYYRVTGQVQFDSYAGASVATMDIMRQSDSSSIVNVFESNNGVHVCLHGSNVVYLEDGDWVYMTASVSGGATAVLVGSKEKTFLTLEGPL